MQKAQKLMDPPGKLRETFTLLFTYHISQSPPKSRPSAVNHASLHLTFSLSSSL